MKKLIAITTLLYFITFPPGRILAQENWSLKWQNNGSFLVYNAQFSPDGEKVLMYDNNYGIKLFNAEDGTLIWSKDNASGVYPEFSPDGNMIAYGESSNILLLDANSGNLLKSFKHDTYISSLDFNPDGKKIIAADREEIKEWDIETGTTDWTILLDSTIGALCFSNDGTKIITISLDNSLKLYNSVTGVVLWTINLSGEISKPVFNPDDSKIICSIGTSIQLLNTSDGSVIWTVNYDESVASMHFSPDGAKVAFIEGTGMRLLNIADGSEIWSVSGAEYTIDYSPNGDRIVSSGSNYAVKVWNANTGKLLWKGYHSEIVPSIHFSPDGKNIVSGGWDNALKIWTSERSITVNSPNGSERFKYPSTKNITWSSINITNVDIEYSTDNGINWSTIVDNIPAKNKSYSWSIPKTPSIQCQIRISDSDSSAINDLNDQPFEIFQPITVTSPNGLEVWKGGTYQDIKWISDSASSVSIAYSTNNGNSWNTIVNNIDATTQSYSWLVPLIISSQCKIKMIDPGNLNISDESDNSFAIYKDLEITSPNGGELFEVSTIQNITWTSKTTENINIELSTDNGNSWSVIAQSVAANLGNYTFLAPDSSFKECKFRISDTSNSNVFDESDSVFSIYKRSLSITSPNGGEFFISGKTFGITWASEYVNEIMIEFTTDNGNSWSTLTKNTTASNKSFSVKVPSVTSPNCKIRITDVENTTIQDESDSVFSVYQPVIALSSPIGDEVWIAGTTQKITWLSSNIENVKLEYTTNAGADWQTIVSSIKAGLWSYDFIVPAISSSQCKIRVSDTSNPETKDESAKLFSIVTPIIVVLAPNGGEALINDETSEITWMSSYVTMVNIEYTTNNGTKWISIADSVLADSASYSWTVPSITSSCKIRISDVGNSDTNDESDDFFNIGPRVGIDSETGNSIPTEYSLLQSYPNPFNPSTTIKYALPQSSHVTLKVYDLLGKEVATLVNENKQAGTYTINFVANNLASGIYFYTINAGSFSQTKKFILTK